MRINHASTLSIDYFVSYLNLIMISREVSLKEAVSYMKYSFFNNNIETYGEITAHNFKQAVERLK